LTIITIKVKINSLIEVNMNKVVSKILQRSVVTQTELGGLNRPIYYILQLLMSYRPSIQSCAKNYYSWLALDKVILQQ